MRVLFCSDPLRRTRIEPDWSTERDAADGNGFDVGLIDDDAVRAGDLQAATRHAGGPGDAIYRGWMLTGSQCAGLHGALATKGITLVNGPDAYTATHHLPESFGAIKDHSPASVWFTQPTNRPLDTEAFRGALSTIGPGPAMIKDWVKSRKHEWEEACFIPDTTDTAHAMEVAHRLIELQGDDLTGGIVVRRFVDLEIIGHHARSGTPLAREWRTFWYDDQLRTAAPYWEEVPRDPSPPIGEFEATAAAIPSRFFSLDLARTTDGEWLIIELGDGQVSGLPPTLSPADFYRSLASATGGG
jgi:ATP-grasp domain, R2K clade family 3